MKKKGKIILGVILGLIIVGGTTAGWVYFQNFRRVPPSDLEFEPSPDLNTTPLTSLVAENLELPWAMEFSTGPT